MDNKKQQPVKQKGKNDMVKFFIAVVIGLAIMLSVLIIKDSPNASLKIIGGVIILLSLIGIGLYYLITFILALKSR